MRTEASVAIDPTVVGHLLVPDVRADHLLIPPDRRNKVPPGPELVAQKVPQLSFHVLRNPDRALPFRYPITSATEYFGGIDINMCTWSGIRCPSSILHSLRRASSWNTVPKCRLICPNSNFLRYFGVNTTWYLHSHVAWFK